MAARTKQTKTPKPELSDIGQIEDVLLPERAGLGLPAATAKGDEPHG